MKKINLKPLRKKFRKNLVFLAGHHTQPEVSKVHHRCSIAKELGIHIPRRFRGWEKYCKAEAEHSMKLVIDILENPM